MGKTNGSVVKRFKFGQVEATIWENEYDDAGKKFTRNSVSLQKSYKDAAGKWQKTGSLGVNDIPRARAALIEAFVYLTRRDNASKPEAPED